MEQNPYQPPEIPSDEPPHPASIIVGGMPGLRGRYRIEWRLIATVVICCIVCASLPFVFEFMGTWWRETSSGGRPNIDSERYQPQSRRLVYTELFRRAAHLHGQRISVVLDATFSQAADIKAARALACDSRALFQTIESYCPPEVARRRIESRLQAGVDASDARPYVYEMQRMRWEPWPSTLPQMRVDTTLPLTDQLQLVISELSSRWSA